MSDRLTSSSFSNFQFFPDSLNVAEDSREHEVVVLSTVPIPCYAVDRQCGLPLVLSVRDPGRPDATLLPASHVKNLQPLLPRRHRLGPDPARRAAVRRPLPLT